VKKVIAAKNVNVAQTAVASIQQNLWGLGRMDSLQHEAYNKIYSLDAFYDHQCGAKNLKIGL